MSNPVGVLRSVKNWGIGANSQDRAFKMGVLNGVLFAVVISTIQPGMVLSAFFLKLTDSTFFATLPLALMHVGSLWPQLIISNVAEARERKKPFYIVAALARVIFLSLMALSTYMLGSNRPGLLIILFPMFYFGYASGSGVCGIAFMDIMGKTIPATRRGKYMGIRGFLGGILGFACGFFVRHMLSDNGPGFPFSYAWLYATAAVFQAATLLAFMGIPEPIKQVKKKRLAFKEHVRQGVSILKVDKNYRLLLTIRFLNSISLVGGMVFIPYAVKALGMPESFVGILMVISICFSLPSNFIWSHIGDQYGNRLLMIISTGIYLVVPIIAAISYYAPPLRTNLPLLNSFDLRVLMFIGAFVLSSITLKGRGMGHMNYLLEISPEERRPSYLAFMSVFLAPTVLVPLIGGLIAELISFQATFMLSFVVGAGSYLLIFRLNEPRKED